MHACSFCSLLQDQQHAAWVMEFAHSVVFLHADQSFRGRVILILKRHVEHYHELPDAEFLQFNDEMRRLAGALQQVFQPDRLNYSVLGNVVAHVHWHVIPRYREDGNWGAPPWPTPTAPVYSEQQFRLMAAQIRAFCLDIG